MGGISDEIGMFAVCWAGKKYLAKNNNTLRQVFTAGQLIEAARIGEAIAQGSVMGSSAQTQQIQQTLY
jgi:hypothetical protein